MHKYNSSSGANGAKNNARNRSAIPPSGPHLWRGRKIRSKFSLTNKFLHFHQKICRAGSLELATTVSNHRRWIPHFFLEYCAGSCSGTVINHMWQQHIPPKNRANAFCPLSSGPKSLFVNEGVESTPKKNVGLPHVASPLARQFWTGYYTRTHRKKKNYESRSFASEPHPLRIPEN